MEWWWSWRWRGEGEGKGWELRSGRWWRVRGGIAYEVVEHMSVPQGMGTPKKLLRTVHCIVLCKTK